MSEWVSEWVSDDDDDDLQQGCLLINEVDWWGHQPSHVTRVYFRYQKPFLLKSAKTGRWHHKSTSLVKETP